MNDFLCGEIWKNVFQEFRTILNILDDIESQILFVISFLSDEYNCNSALFIYLLQNTQIIYEYIEYIGTVKKKSNHSDTTKLCYLIPFHTPHFRHLLT